MNSAARNGSSIQRRGTFLLSFGRPIFGSNLKFDIVHLKSSKRTSSKASLRYGNEPNINAKLTRTRQGVHAQQSPLDSCPLGPIFHQAKKYPQHMSVALQTSYIT